MLRSHPARNIARAALRQSHCAARQLPNPSLPAGIAAVRKGAAAIRNQATAATATASATATAPATYGPPARDSRSYTHCGADNPGKVPLQLSILLLRNETTQILYNMDGTNLRWTNREF